jgi:spore coat polysaccharide biosynthesis predicted glycosyltransferase SpsG
LSQLEPTTLAGTVQKGGNVWLEADAPAGTPEDLEELTQEIRRIRPAAVIVDSAQCGPDYLAELVTLGPLVATIDTSAAFRNPAQLVINPSLSQGIEDYEVCPGTQVLVGRRYAQVRPEIRRIRPARAQEPAEPLRVLVGFGDDPQNLTSKVASLLLNQPKIGYLDLLARVQHPQLPEWQALAEAHPGRVSLCVETAEMAAKISRCHFAVCEGNSWALELACVGVPMLNIVQDEAWFRTAQRLEEEGAATCLGWHSHVAESTIKTAVQTLAGDPLERRAMARCGRALIDGRGPDRLVTALEVLLHPSRQIDLSEAA